MVNKGLISNIQRFSLHDGPGIRTTVFFKGCAARCWWCHNPEAMAETPDDKQLDAKELLTEIKKDVIFYDTSEGGVTFYGGEPLVQHEFLEEILSKCRKEYIHIALDTSGYAPKEVFEKIIDHIDLFLYDLKLMDDEEHKKYTGVSNDLIIENLKTLSGRADKAMNTIIRFPVIPGITDKGENVLQIKEFVSSLKNINEVNLLPYHKMAEAKYQKLGLEYKLQGLMPPSDERMQELKKEFEDYRFKVKIGG